MTQRRYTDKPDLDPEAVTGLDVDHPAMRGNRTLFPGTVVDVTPERPDRLLVSGQNSRKLGALVTKGSLAGKGLYGLTLEERATCPAACSVRDACYGNGMPFARRHRIGDPATFERRLRAEIGQLLARHAAGILVRLHVLGDFPDPAYVAMWGRLLRVHPGLSCYGYTHRLPARAGGCATGDAIAGLKRLYPDRFRVRWSVTAPRADAAVVVDAIPARGATAGLVCPAQTDATACCASCGLCWEPAARDRAILFVRHGTKRGVAAAAAAMRAIEKGRAETSVAGARRIMPIPMPPNQKPAVPAGTVPRFLMVDPRSLLVEEGYQRDLSGPSIKLIRRIVTGWDWSRFKPPICAESGDGLFVIDGQHTAIGAATHGGIHEIPVMVLDALALEDRARAFVGHNRDRVPMSDFAILVAEAAAGVSRSIEILGAIEAAGGQVPRVLPGKGRSKPGEITAIGAARAVHASLGADHLRRVVRIAIDAGVRPIDSNALQGLHLFLTDPRHAGVPDGETARALRAVAEVGDIGRQALELSALQGMGSRYRGVAELVSRRLPDGLVLRPPPPAPVGDAGPPQRPRAPKGTIHRRGPRGPNFDWTPERMATLKTMLADGRSRTEIAATIGAGVTVNAVLGMCHRVRKGIR